jgi:hypothetical protein
MIWSLAAAVLGGNMAAGRPPHVAPQYWVVLVVLEEDNRIQMVDQMYQQLN